MASSSLVLRHYPSGLEGRRYGPSRERLRQGWVRRGARLLSPNETLQHAGVIVGIHVTGACLMMRRAVFEEVGGFDEAFDISYNDVDLCLRVRARGYLVVYTPYAVLYHHQSASRGGYIGLITASPGGATRCASDCS